MDQYEMRSYDGWYKRITFACLALALLTFLSCNSFDHLTMQQHNPAASSLDTFKKLLVRFVALRYLRNDAFLNF